MKVAPIQPAVAPVLAGTLLLNIDLTGVILKADGAPVPNLIPGVIRVVNKSKLNANAVRAIRPVGQVPFQ